MIAEDFRHILAGVMREQGLNTPEAARLCGISLPIFVQLLQGPTTTDLVGAERVLNRLGVGLRLERTPYRNDVAGFYTMVGQSIAEEA